MPRKPSNHNKNKHVGPGGLDCGCCLPLRSKKESRTWLNRQSRRATRQVKQPEEEADA